MFVIIDLCWCRNRFLIVDNKTTQTVVKFLDLTVLSDVKTDYIRRVILAFGTRDVWLVHYCWNLATRAIRFRINLNDIVRPCSLVT